ncbi:MAG: bifunctional phosphopantothenoylcysteine decarboxylase/phosphopantothenate--cysteine ligase CoaBC [Methanocellales archaeon]
MHEVHPAFDIKAAKAKTLLGKKIVLGVTGSIAAVECIKLARELIRHGAEVYAVMSKEATRILHPNALEYATGHKVITEISGAVEHIEHCGEREAKASLLLIAPCTANTISKIACGIDDTPVTTFATTALGSKIPIMIAPAMHASMYSHAIVGENIERLRKIGIKFISPRIEEEAAKLASVEEIVINVERALGANELAGKKILITGGGTAEALDPIRILTNRSSGRTGVELANEAYRRGASITLVHRSNLNCTSSEIKTIYVESVEEMINAVMKELESEKYDILISAAAISDFTLARSATKIKSGEPVLLRLKPAPKLIKMVREKYPDLYLVGFKAETYVSEEELIKRAKFARQRDRLNLIVANDVGSGGMGGESNVVFIISEKNVERVSGLKREIAAKIFEAVLRDLNANW